ncbi:Sensor histidine kinase response regulator [Lasiodiplodia theobromae]|uniref:Sensor histidine kinase response regulator n=1 Tax=Lasiodiplodia theobromae TaxID=45133 RepID=UPI0015C3DD01|nr:Sensor histidine kinase response regulator [Lasiodiplodia theobromae]KAF4546168.1 Sensor histidine kinase response regulator [Lasiodiplodia theobromae]
MGSAPLLLTQAERERERDVIPFHPLSLDIPVLDASPHTLPPPSHCPRPSSDAVLTAIAQLAALRLGARRALISLIDSRAHEALWLGCATIPRECGLCELVLDAGGSAVVINDVQHDTRSAAHSFLKRTPSLRFYASVPLVAQTGSTIGAVAVFDDAPRSGLAPPLVRALHDVAAAAMSYLNASRALDNNCRAERLVRGLTSFVTGADDLQHHADLDMPRSPPNPTALSPLPNASNVPVLERPVVSRNSDELPALQNMILPPGAKRMFSRAANIMRASGGFSGVIIFDASLANPGGASAPSTPAASPPLGPPDSTIDDDAPASCKILGFADGDASSSRAGTSPKSDYLTLAESDLKRLLNQNPHGKIFAFNSGAAESSREETSRRQGRRRKFSAAAAILAVAQDARSAAVVPLWDYQRQRWLAGCLCWTTDARRVLSHGSDLLYLRTFGNSVMTELSRLDALSVDRAKSTFIESISHELRSPLHGILGGIEYLRGTELDAAQSGIVASIGVCGRTLLDTVRNVLEYSKINENLGSSPWRRHHHHAMSTATTPTADIRQLTEETVEAVFAGHSYSVLSATQAEDGGDEPFMRIGSHDMPSSPTGPPVRRAIRIILDMPENRPWHLALQPGIWRRIVMNVFGNALKFTHTGFIRVSLSATDMGESETRVSLTVADSGAGMSPQFLSDGLFKPFSQENPFVPGTGLGMSIVRRLVDSLGGSISVQSQQNVGTEIRITATLRKRVCRGENVISAIAARLQGTRICIPDGLASNNHAAPAAVVRGERYFVESITQSLRECFGVHVSTDVDPDGDQLVVYPGPDMTCMSKSRPHKGMSVIVALDALEAATLRTDARIAGGCVEVVTQPCGPYKLARILERYLNRCQPAASQPTQTSVLPLSHPRPSTPTTTTDPARPPHPPWPLARLPTFRPTPTTPDPLSPPRRASIPHLLSSSTSTDSVPRHRQRHHHPPSTATTTSALPPKPRSRSASTTSTPRHRKPEILIVDDNPLNVRLLSAFLTKHGFPDHVAAPNGLEAVRLFKAEPRRWAAILMDLSMPVMDGATATREIRAWERYLAAAARARKGGGAGAGGLVVVDGEGTRDSAVAVISGCEQSSSSSRSREELEDKRQQQQQHYSAPSIRPNGIVGQQPDADADAGVQIIVTTGLGSATARFEALSAGADEYMTKPIQFGTLMKMLNKRFEDRGTAAAAPRRS